jgi:hypothetical protein
MKRLEFLSYGRAMKKERFTTFHDDANKHEVFEQKLAPFVAIDNHCLQINQSDSTKNSVTQQNSFFID